VRSEAWEGCVSEHRTDNGAGRMRAVALAPLSLRCRFGCASIRLSTVWRACRLRSRTGQFELPCPLSRAVGRLEAEAGRLIGFRWD
jgi:hypothetical protein